jgi:hypothetical protein
MTFKYDDVSLKVIRMPVESGNRRRETSSDSWKA